jgi:hypothetical protein
MAYLTSPRWSSNKTIRNIQLPLAGSQTAYQGGMCSALTTAGTVYPAQNASNHLVIGQFFESNNNSASTATSYVNVELAREIDCFWYDNATGGGAVVAANLFSNVYVQDDHTVSTSAGAASIIAGRVWHIDSSLGVLVQPNQL